MCDKVMLATVEPAEMRSVEGGGWVTTTVGGFANGNAIILAGIYAWSGLVDWANGGKGNQITQFGEGLGNLAYKLIH